MKRSPVATETSIVLGSRTLNLRRPVRVDLARRLVVVHPQLTALNAALKSQKDAASALGVSVPLMRIWLDVLGIKWTNVQPRAPYMHRS